MSKLRTVLTVAVVLLVRKRRVARLAALLGQRARHARPEPGPLGPEWALKPVSGPRAAARLGPLNARIPLWRAGFVEAADGTRTHDLLHGKQGSRDEADRANPHDPAVSDEFAPKMDGSDPDG